MKIRPLFVCGLAFLFFLTVTLRSQTVRFEFNVGSIDVELLPSDAPKTVANSFQYLNAGYYAGSFIHRSVPGFVIQGGGYQWSNASGPVPIPSNPPVVNEFKVSNTAGTIA